MTTLEKQHVLHDFVNGLWGLMKSTCDVSVMDDNSWKQAVSVANKITIPKTEADDNIKQVMREMSVAWLGYLEREERKRNESRKSL